MKSNSTKARSLVLSAFVLIAVGTSILSALYVSGLVGHSNPSQTQSSQSTTQMSPGGFMLARNVTLTTCIISTTNNTASSQTTNSTTSTGDCLPNGIR